MVRTGLIECNDSQTHTILGSGKTAHIRNHLHLGYHLVLLHHFPGLLIEFRDDTRYLRFDIHLVTRFYLSGDDGGFLKVLDLNLVQFIHHLLWARLYVQVHKGSNYQGNHSHDGSPFQHLLH